MQRIDIIAKKLEVPYKYTQTNSFIKRKKVNREIHVKINLIRNINMDRLLAKVVKKQLQNSLSFLCVLKVNNKYV